MPRDEAKSIIDKADNKARAKAKASKAILSALEDLMAEQVQTPGPLRLPAGGIPRQLKTELSKVAKAKGSDPPG